jgi:peptidoglycan/LPS O-acetylase OafA/YrhL
MKSFSQEFNPKNNSIGFLRFALASAVIVSHSWPIGGFGTEILARATGDHCDFGYAAVDGFFLLSGYLITASYARLSSLRIFLWHRFLRIMPGFWVCLFITAGLFGPALYYLKNGVTEGYWSAANGPTAYLLNNWLLKVRQTDIANATSGLIFPGHINGSLWTLYYEAGCYLVVALLGACRLLFRKYVAVALTLSVAVFPYISNFHARRMLLAFLVGVLWFLFKDRIPLDGRIALASACALAIFARTPQVWRALPLFGGYLLFYSAAKLPVRNFDRKGDFSYGIYIYAFPIQQILAAFGLNRFGIFPFFLVSFFSTLPFAILSFYLIEKPSLNLKDGLWLRTRLSALSYIPTRR